MRLSPMLVTLAACLYHNFGCVVTAPARTTDEVLLGEVDIAVRDVDTNEVTTKLFEKKCIVDGKSYSHAQAVSYDANSRCICVAGNVYCFWHGLPPTTELPAESRNNDEDEELSSTEAACRDSSLPTEIVNESPPPPASASVNDLADVYKNIDKEKSEEIDDDDDEDLVNDNDDDDDDDEEDEAVQNARSEESTENAATTVKNNLPTTPITCVVLDRTYRVGEVLPHNTGNCVECSCGPEGHVVCAPRDCVSIVPHRGYREESFQIPVAGDLRGIDENF